MVAIIRWALTHPLSVEKTEKLKNKQMKPNFLDMVPWYSGYVFFLFLLYMSNLRTYMYLFYVFMLMFMYLCCRTSADLFKTVFDLLVSVTVFVGRFDMRMMQVQNLSIYSVLLDKL